MHVSIYRIICVILVIIQIRYTDILHDIVMIKIIATVTVVQNHAETQTSIIRQIEKESKVFPMQLKIKY